MTESTRRSCNHSCRRCWTCKIDGSPPQFLKLTIDQRMGGFAREFISDNLKIDGKIESFRALTNRWLPVTAFGYRYRCLLLYYRPCS